MPINEAFNLTNLLITSIALIIFTKVSLKRRYYVLWWFVYFSIFLIELFKLFQDFLTLSDETLFLIQLIPSIFIFFAVLKHYYETFLLPKRMKNIFTIQFISFISIFIENFYLFITILLILSLIMLIRIYIEEKTPTHAFFAILILLALISTVFPYFLLIQSFLTLLFATSLVALIEDHVIESRHQTQKAFNRAEFYKDLFAHDMNNILQSIKSATELLILLKEDEDFSQKFEELIRILTNQVARGEKLVSNIMKLSQLREKIDLQYLDLSLYLAKAIENIKNLEMTKEIQISLNPAEIDMRILADDFLLDVFENILYNAIKHNLKTKVEIVVNVYKLRIRRTHFLRVEFIDNGIGIPDEDKREIFKNIFKKSPDHRRRGIGLSLVKLILKNNKGKIWVENKVEGDYSQGSKFIVLIPLAVKSKHYAKLSN